MLHPMSAPASAARSGLQRYAFAGLIAVAAFMVGTVAYVVVSDERAIAAEEIFPETVRVDPEKRPDFQFPESVRTYDPALNRFIDRFARICMEGKYSEFRLMCTSRVSPLSPRRFESIFHAVKEIRILSVNLLPVLPKMPGPIYVMRAEYDLKPEYIRRSTGSDEPVKTKSVQVALTLEDGTWRIGPIPREGAAALAALHDAAARPAVDLFDGEDPRAAPLPPPSANQPATITSDD